MSVKPVVKWVGGKRQLVPILKEKMPTNYGKYIEPFFGGGALYFAEEPKNAVISDVNAELINLYKVIADDVEGLIEALKKYKYDKDFYYKIRAIDPKELNSIEEAARTIYLNRTGFNGLYRVNKKGQFNVPFGRYKNPKILDAENLRNASKLLKTAIIINGDYLDVLSQFAEPGDFIYLDPPYVPVSKYSDFNRYTSDKFTFKDQTRLVDEVKRLRDLGCYVLLTNSNAPEVSNIYKGFDIETFETKRMVNSKANKRKGMDVIVTAYPEDEKLIPDIIPEQNNYYPSTRYMGSKEKLIPYISSALKGVKYDSVLDLFSGSGVVSYFFKTLNKTVISNDYMTFTSDFSKALIENNKVKLDHKDIDFLINNRPNDINYFVSENFKDLYFSDEDNKFIDIIRANYKQLNNPYKKAITMSALTRACIKRRPRGIFTFTGNRYYDGRKDLRISLKDHFLNAVKIYNAAVFDNKKKNISLNEDFQKVNNEADLIYLDPPYYSPLSDNEYVRRYHFVEGLSRDWQNVEIQWNTKTHKIKNYPSPFSTKKGTYEAFEALFKKYSKKKILVSYSSNSLPTKDEMIEMMKKSFKNVKTYAVDYRYSFGTHKNHKNNKNNQVKEYLFLGFNKNE